MKNKNNGKVILLYLLIGSIPVCLVLDLVEYIGKLYHFFK